MGFYGTSAEAAEAEVNDIIAGRHELSKRYLHGEPGAKAEVLRLQRIAEESKGNVPVGLVSDPERLRIERLHQDAAKELDAFMDGSHPQARLYRENHPEVVETVKRLMDETRGGPERRPEPGEVQVKHSADGRPTSFRAAIDMDQIVPPAWERTEPKPLAPEEPRRYAPVSLSDPWPDSAA
jgi:hypothetical protein